MVVVGLSVLTTEDENSLIVFVVIERSVVFCWKLNELKTVVAFDVAVSKEFTSDTSTITNSF